MNKFVVYSGNNPQVIREALLKRGNWEEVSNFQLIRELTLIYFQKKKDS